MTADDEMLALRRLQILLRGMANVEHVGEASSCAEALARSAALAPDVILLDIKMRDGDAFDVVEELAHRADAPIIIFVTAFDQYAVRAFEAAVAEYLQSIVRNLRASIAKEHGDGFETEFWLRGPNGIVQVPIDLIDCVSSEDDYVAIHTRNGSHLMRGSIRKFEGQIEQGQFVRVHRAWLVRKTSIAELRTPRIGSAEILLRSGKKVPVGRVYLRNLRRDTMKRNGVA
jgi:DNA-binding LytR/AlgR family response regulator